MDLPTQEIGVGALGCIHALAQRVVEVSARLQERCIYDSDVHGRTEQLADELKRDIAKLGERAKGLVRPAEGPRQFAPQDFAPLHNDNQRQGGAA